MNNTLEAKRAKGFSFVFRNARYFIFFGLIVVFTGMSQKFLGWQNISSLLLTTTPLAIATIGTTFVILTGGIDLSVGSIILLSGSVGVHVANTGAGFIPALLAAILAGCAAGCINGLLITRFKLVPFLATLATSALFRGLILQFGSSGYIICKDASFMMTVTQNRILGIPLITWILAVIVLVVEVLLKKTPFGWHLYAVGSNIEAAKKAGIKADRIKRTAYILCGALTGVTGFLNMCLVGSIPTNFGDGQEFTIISAAVLGGVSLLGGRGSVFPGAMIGIFIFTMIENGMTLISANAYFYTVIRAGVIFLAILIDSITKKSSELR